MNHKYTKEQHEFIKDNHIGISNKELTERFNTEFGTQLSLIQMSNYLRNRGWRNGRDTRWKKGEVEDNGHRFKKGDTRGIPYQFKKGHTGYNTREIGATTNQHGYTWVKVGQPNEWKPLHRIEWEKHNGEIPEGMVVLFKDQDKTNVDIDNLALVSKAEIAMMNMLGWTSNEKELTEVGITLSRLILKQSKLKKKAKKGK